MRVSNLLRPALFITCFLFLRLLAAGQQVQVKGTIYERTERYGMEGVSVICTCGGGTITDSLGHYSIHVNLTDSLSFSYQGKATMKFPVKEIPRGHPFDLGLHVDIKVLPTLVVQQKSYKEDSLEFREEYRKVFDYHNDLLSMGMGGVGLNLDMLLSQRKIKRMEHFKAQLEEIERQKYITHRFNIGLVKRLTGLESPALDTFMVQYRPSFEMLQSFENEYEFMEYIKGWGHYFAAKWKEEHP